MRLLKHLKSDRAWTPFFGVEGDYVSFDVDHASGTGGAGEVFAGLEYFFLKRVSAQFDMGAAYIAVKEDRYSVADTGFDAVANFQLNLYFSRANR